MPVDLATEPQTAKVDPVVQMAEEARRTQATIPIQDFLDAILKTSPDYGGMEPRAAVRTFIKRNPGHGFEDLDFEVDAPEEKTQTQTQTQTQTDGGQGTGKPGGPGPAPSTDIWNALRRSSIKAVGGLEEFGANLIQDASDFVGWLQPEAVADARTVAQTVVPPIRAHAQHEYAKAATMAPPSGFPAQLAAAGPKVIETIAPYMLAPEARAEQAVGKGIGLMGKAGALIRAKGPTALKTGAKMAGVEAIRASDQGPAAATQAGAMGAALGAFGFPVAGELLEAGGRMLSPAVVKYVPQAVRRFLSGALPTYALEQTTDKPQEEKLATSIAYGGIAVPGGPKKAKATEVKTGTPPAAPGAATAAAPAAGGPGGPGAPGAPGAPAVEPVVLSKPAKKALATIVRDYSRDPANHVVTKGSIAGHESVDIKVANKILGELRRADVLGDAGSGRGKVLPGHPEVQALLPAGWTAPPPGKPAATKPAGAGAGAKPLTAEQAAGFGAPAEAPAAAAPEATAESSAAAEGMKQRVTEAAAGGEGGPAPVGDQTAAVISGLEAKVEAGRQALAYVKAQMAAGSPVTREDIQRKFRLGYGAAEYILKVANEPVAPTPEKPAEPAAATGEPVEDAATLRAKIAELEAKMKAAEGGAAVTPPAAPAAAETEVTPPTPPVTPPAAETEVIPPTPPKTEPPVEPPKAEPQPAAAGAETRFSQLPRNIQEQIAVEALRQDGHPDTPEDVQNVIQELSREGETRPTREMLTSMAGPAATGIYDQHVGTVPGPTETPLHALPTAAREQIAAAILRSIQEEPTPEKIDQTIADIKQAEEGLPDRSFRDRIMRMGGQEALDLYDQHVKNLSVTGVNRAQEDAAAGARRVAQEAYDKIAGWAEKLTRTTGSGRKKKKTTQADVLRGQNQTVAEQFEQFPDKVATMTKEEADAAVATFSTHVKAMNALRRPEKAEKTAEPVTAAEPTAAPPEPPVTEEQAKAAADALISHGKARLKEEVGSQAIGGRLPLQPGELPPEEVISNLKTYGRYLLQQGIRRSQAWLDSMTQKFGEAIEPRTLIGVWQNIIPRGPGIPPATNVPGKPRMLTLPSGEELPLTQTVLRQGPGGYRPVEEDLLTRLRARGPSATSPQPTPEPTEPPPARIGVSGPRTAPEPVFLGEKRSPGYAASTPPPATLRLRSGEVPFPAASLPENFRPVVAEQRGAEVEARLAEDAARRLGKPVGEVDRESLGDRPQRFLTPKAEAKVAEKGIPLEKAQGAPLTRREGTQRISTPEYVVSDKPFGKVITRSTVEKMSNEDLADAVHANEPVEIDNEAIPVDKLQDEFAKRVRLGFIKAERLRTNDVKAEQRSAAQLAPRRELPDTELESRRAKVTAAREARLRTEAESKAEAGKRIQAREEAGKTLGTETPPAAIPKPAPLPEPIPEGSMKEGMEKAGFKAPEGRPASTRELLALAGFQFRAIHRQFTGTDRPHIGGKRPEALTPGEKDPMLIQRPMPISGVRAQEVGTKAFKDGVIEVQTVPGEKGSFTRDASGDLGDYRGATNEFVATKYFRDGREPVVHHGQGLQELHSYLNNVLQTEEPIPPSQAATPSYGSATPVRMSRPVPETEPPPDELTQKRQRRLNILSPPPEAAAKKQLAKTAEVLPTKGELKTVLTRIEERAEEQGKPVTPPTPEKSAANKKRLAQIDRENREQRRQDVEERMPVEAMSPEQLKKREAALVAGKARSKEKSEIKREEEPRELPPEKNAAALNIIAKTEPERKAALARIEAGRTLTMPPEERFAKAVPVAEAPTGRKFVRPPKESPFEVVPVSGESKKEPEKGVQKVAGLYRVAVKGAKAKQIAETRAGFGEEEPVPVTDLSGFGEEGKEPEGDTGPAAAAAEIARKKAAEVIEEAGITIRELNNGIYEIKRGSGPTEVTTKMAGLTAAQNEAVRIADQALAQRADAGYELPGVGTYRAIGDAKGRAPMMDPKTGQMKVDKKTGKTKLFSQPGKNYEFIPTSGEPKVGHTVPGKKTGQPHKGWMPNARWDAIRGQSMPLTEAPPAKPTANP